MSQAVWTLPGGSELFAANSSRSGSSPSMYSRTDAKKFGSSLLAAISAGPMPVRLRNRPRRAMSLARNDKP